MRNKPNSPQWMFWLLMAAAIYNILWGLWVVVMPFSFFDLVSIPRPQYPQLWQCIGMIVGVYGIGYGIAAFDPLQHWPILLVGLLGKLFGPLGFLMAIINRELPLAFGATIITNDLIWWIPFSLILYQAYIRRKVKNQSPSPVQHPQS